MSHIPDLCVLDFKLEINKLPLTVPRLGISELWRALLQLTGFWTATITNVALEVMLKRVKWSL